MCTFGADCTNYRQIRPFKLFVVHIYFGALSSLAQLLRDLELGCAAQYKILHNTNYAN